MHWSNDSFYNSMVQNNNVCKPRNSEPQKHLVADVNFSISRVFQNFKKNDLQRLSQILVGGGDRREVYNTKRLKKISPISIYQHPTKPRLHLPPFIRIYLGCVKERTHFFLFPFHILWDFLLLLIFPLSFWHNKGDPFFNRRD